MNDLERIRAEHTDQCQRAQELAGKIWRALVAKFRAFEPRPYEVIEPLVMEALQSEYELGGRRGRYDG